MIVQIFNHDSVMLYYTTEDVQKSGIIPNEGDYIYLHPKDCKTWKLKPFSLLLVSHRKIDRENLLIILTSPCSHQLI